MRTARSRRAAPAQVHLPPAMRRLAISTGVAVLEHPDLDVRSHEALLAAMLARPGDVVLIAPALARVRWRVRQWLGRRARRAVVGKVESWRAGATTLWLAAEAERVDEVPVPHVAALAAADCHLLRVDPVDRLGARLVGDALLAGALAERGHWFYRRARGAGDALLRLELAEAVAQYPDQASRVLPEGHPRRARAMELRDVDEGRRPFGAFARDRLWIRTNKPAEVMSDRQRTEAQRQLGADWTARTAVTGQALVPFELTDLQRRYRAMKRLGRSKGFRKFVVCKYRQGGITTTEQAESYQACTERQRVKVATLAHTREATERIFQIALTFHENDHAAPPRVGESRSKLEFRNGSTFYLGTAGARGFTRGETLSRVHGSEAAWWQPGPRQFADVDRLIAGLTGALGPGEMVLESTPNGREWFGQTYAAAKKGENDFCPVFLAWFDDPNNRAPAGTFDVEELRATASEEELELCQRHKLTFAQLAFRRQQQRSLPSLWRQEWPEDDESCFIVSGTCWFNVDGVLLLLRELSPTVQRAIPGGVEVRYEEPIPGVEYVAGCDTSEGLPGCDPNGVGILRKDTGEQVAEIHGRFRPDRLGREAVRICKDYNGALLAIERNNHGHAVIAAAAACGGGYGKAHGLGGRMFHHRPSRDSARERAGWDTNEISRAIMLEDLAKAVELRAKKEPGGMGIRSREFLSECTTFRLQSDGQFRADSGSHDDRVMKWAIAWQMLKVRRGGAGLVVLEGGV